MEYYGRGQKRSVLPVFLAALLGALVGGALVVWYLSDFTKANPVTHVEDGIIDVGQYVADNPSEYPATAISEALKPAVVGVSNFQRGGGTYGFFGGTELAEVGSGSGFIYDAAKGYIVTNHHVIENAAEIMVTLYDGRNVQATLIGGDTRSDLAVIQISETENLKSMPIGDSNSLRVGEPVIAIGNPGGQSFANSLTQGIVSALNRFLELKGEASFNLIQTDAAINPGNSGGPLVSFEGKVIGINSAKNNMRGFEGMGFAIPISDAEPVIRQFIEKGYASYAALMVSINEDYTPEYAAYIKSPEGCYIARTESGGGAERAGVKAGDIVTAINGAPARNALQLSHELFKYKAGDMVDVTYFRDGASYVVRVVLGELRS
ncbi:MAG: trypsin-like peptidase domain-containing protein [Peptococcaceae bacterium]|nr:trypsin-like peptidase domain-containing protein [Peptococcaceae bacterium]